MARATVPSFGPPDIVEIVPRVPSRDDDSRMMGDHADVFGWSADQTELGYCGSFGGAPADACAFLRRDGTRDSLAVSTFTENPALRRKLVDRRAHAKLAVLPASWRFASDLVITWRAVIPKEAGKREGVHVSLQVGAQVRGEAASFAITHDARDCATVIHPETIALSADGEVLGVISHALTSGDLCDGLDMTLTPVSMLAGRAFNDAGFAHHKKEDFVRSAELFEKATLADPSFALPVYNLACARARLGDARTERTLAEAVERDPTAKERARKDLDFVRLRYVPWFAALTQ